MNGRPAFSRKSFVRVAAPAMLVAAASLAGCADLKRAVSLPPVNPESPVAPAVALAATGHYAVPRLTDVPPIPRNIPVAGDVKLDVVAMVRCRGGVERFAATHPPMSSGTASFAAGLREVAQVNPADVPPPDSAVRSEAEAAQLRAYAAPPAAIASGPPPTPADAQPPAPPPPPGARTAPRAAPHPLPARLPQLASAPKPAAPAPAVPTTPAAEPPFPPPLPDPMLARCS